MTLSHLHDVLPATYTVHIGDVPKGQLRVPRAARLSSFGALRLFEGGPILFRTDQEGVDLVLTKKLAPVRSVSQLGLVDPVQAVQRGPGDVDASGRERERSRLEDDVVA